MLFKRYGIFFSIFLFLFSFPINDNALAACNRYSDADEHVTGSERLEEVLMRYHGNAIAPPIHSYHQPSLDFIKWHRDIRFREKPRP